ncbi:unnamed protein product [Pseudo-nitzschia multistriata]|uniref:Uncharacterized protein n=1 Tax=Pseudo-nitzschia multistriata TaxID=183589 RepID=A0A448Z1S7_9STRA|nr:unnamed protein product [Pseudo-nitzschia multistriata]
MDATSTSKYLPISRVFQSPPIMMSKTEISQGEPVENVFDTETSALASLMENEENEKSLNPTPALVSILKNEREKLDATKNDTGTNDAKLRGMQSVAAALAFALAFMPVSEADAAATGGRMGGSFSAAPRQTISRPAQMRTYSSPGYSARPRVTVAPSIGIGSYGYGYSTPYFSPYVSPFAGPRVYGGTGVMTVSRGPSFFDLLFFGGFLFAVSSIFRQNNAVSTDAWTSSSVDWGTRSAESVLGPGTSVVKLSVALEVSDRDDRNSILSVLNRLSQSARTDSRIGIQNLSSQVALEILRRRSSIVSASSSTKHFRNREKALRDFQDRSIKERSKFENETVSKYGGVDYAASSPSLQGSGANAGNTDNATMAVVTLVLAIDGDSTKLNKINSISDVEQALQKIAADSKVGDCLQSAEILWTPEARSETLGIRDVVADYPELRSV